jgi:succinate-semialdehyde dehydrogenase/glutarate-semialdehyde dehydrogenase
MSLDVIDPATGKTLRSYEEATPDEVDSILAVADRTQREWGEVPLAERARPMRRAAELLRERSDRYGRLMAEEMGKPIRAGRSEAEKCAWACDYYAEHAASFLAEQPAATDARESFVTFRPLGVVLAIMPWNFPFWQVFRFVAPALMAGNGAVLKHASNVPGCALAIEELLREAGFPEGLFRALLISSGAVDRVLESPVVRAATLTGSEAAGRAVAAKAGALLKKTVLELGGSDPYVVLADADLETAMDACVRSRLINSGQSCIAAKRFIVTGDRKAELERGVVERMQAARVGPPLDEETEVGPLARRDLREELHDQVRRSMEQGARCLVGGEIPDGPGAFYPPTVLTDVGPGMPAYDEETFGPVAAILEAKDDDDAIRIANDTAFGLGAAVFTADPERGRRIAAEALDAGCCFVNTFVQSDPRLPFGGVKNSGYGRELAAFGIRELVNVKTVWVE